MFGKKRKMLYKLEKYEYGDNQKKSYMGVNMLINIFIHDIAC